MGASLALGGMGSILTRVGILGASAALNYMVSDKRDSNAQKLEDLKVSSSVYGRGVAQLYGTMRATGNMIWATDIEERKRYIGAKGKEKNSKKGKKGKAEEVYEYYGYFAMALCEGPIDEVIRIWADSNLIFDKLSPDEAEDPGFSQPEDNTGGKLGLGGNKKGENANSGRWPFRVYGGSEDQDPDPYIAGFKPDATPAYRGIAYIMFEEFPLADFGNRIPTITADRKSVV